jgi:hypothetical protein
MLPPRLWRLIESETSAERNRRVLGRVQFPGDGSRRRIRLWLVLFCAITESLDLHPAPRSARAFRRAAREEEESLVPFVAYLFELCTQVPPSHHLHRRRDDVRRGQDCRAAERAVRGRTQSRGIDRRAAREEEESLVPFVAYLFELCTQVPPSTMRVFGQDIIIFIVGGTTYEEAKTVAQLNAQFAAGHNLAGSFRRAAREEEESLVPFVAYLFELCTQVPPSTMRVIFIVGGTTYEEAKTVAQLNAQFAAGHNLAGSIGPRSARQCTGS